MLKYTEACSLWNKLVGDLLTEKILQGLYDVNPYSSGTHVTREGDEMPD
jgi:hypothetical protein